MDSLALFLNVNYGVSMIPVNHLNESAYFEMNQRLFNAHIKLNNTLFPGAKEFATKLHKHFCMQTHCKFKIVLSLKIVIIPIQLSVRIDALNQNTQKRL